MVNVTREYKKGAPYKSSTNHDAIWFNVDHIEQTRRLGKKTQVDLSNGVTMIIDSTITAFNAKITIAKQLKDITKRKIEMGKSSHLKAKSYEA